MRIALLGFLLLSVAVVAQQAPAPAVRPLIVRSVRIENVSTSSTPLVPISMDEFAAALKRDGVHFAVENAFDPAAVEKAAGVLGLMYKNAGQQVRVEHTASPIPPHSVEVSFEVIQLCSCH